ncbi:multiprotein-bridging factor 1 family protein [Halobacteriaceae archaeon GCM10025711]
MPKYSTGGSSGGGGGRTCELCGKPADSLTPANVAGAKLDVCEECADHSDTAHGRDKESRRTKTAQRGRKTAQNIARASDAVGGDSTHWEEEGTNYERDRLPYLVRDYGQRVTAARQDAGLQRDELAAELDVDENDLFAVEQGRANQANVGGSVIRKLEERLDVALVDE